MADAIFRRLIRRSAERRINLFSRLFERQFQHRFLHDALAAFDAPVRDERKRDAAQGELTDQRVEALRMLRSGRERHADAGHGEGGQPREQPACGRRRGMVGLCCAVEPGAAGRGSRARAEGRDAEPPVTSRTGVGAGRSWDGTGPR